MLKQLILIVCCAGLTGTGHAQKDTFILGDFRVALSKGKPMLAFFSDSDVTLPCEYKSLNAKEYRLEHKYRNPDTFRQKTDSAGNPYLVAFDGDKDVFGRTPGGSITFTGVIEGIRLSYRAHSGLVAVIKARNVTYPVCSATLYRLRGDTLTTCYMESLGHPLEVDFSIEQNSGKLKENRYVLTDIQYRKGAKTYYLSGSFVIGIED